MGVTILLYYYLLFRISFDKGSLVVVFYKQMSMVDI